MGRALATENLNNENMLFKAGLLASSLVAYATSTSFDYQVRCDYLVQAIESTVKTEETWYSTASSKSQYNSLSTSMSAGFKKGSIGGNVAVAMAKVSKTATASSNAGSRKTHHKVTFQPNSNQVHRSCKHSVFVNGQILSFTETTYVHTERNNFKGQLHYEKLARDWMNANIVPQLQGAPKVTQGTTLTLNYGVNIPSHDGWTEQAEVEVTAGLWGNWVPLKCALRIITLNLLRFEMCQTKDRV